MRVLASRPVVWRDGKENAMSRGNIICRAAVLLSGLALLGGVAAAAELQRRVEQTARDACKELDDRYPFEPKQADECAKSATDKAKAQVEAAIAAAEKTH
jgi:UrcA family protein